METNDERQLWIDLQEGNFFLLPRERSLPEGERLIYTLTGNIQQVDAGALDAWQVSQEAMQAHLEKQMAAFLEELEGPHPAAPDSQPTERPARQTGAAGADRQSSNLLVQLAESSGDEADQEELELHEAIAYLLDQLALTIEDCIAGDEARLDAARRRARDFRSEMIANGSDISDSIEHLPDQLHHWYQASDNPEAWHEQIAAIRAFAGELREMPLDEQGFEQFTSRVTQLAGNLFGWFDVTETEEQRRARYRELARRAMPHQRDNLPRFDFKKAWAARKRRES